MQNLFEYISLDPLLAWFSVSKRSFPWRQNASPYSVLVSEIMLQQTQACRVVDYFQRWMEVFPTIFMLAQADEIQVLKAWEGLGYYSRARSLHLCAKIICENYGGVIPSSKTELLQLPGIGPYTAGAIMSFAYHQRAEAVDANVRRVLCRMVKGCFENGVEGVVEGILPSNNPWEAMEALIELGALVCTKIPGCDGCPCKDQCYAHSTGRVVELTRCTKNTRTFLWRDVAVFICQNSLLVKKPSRLAVMAGLYEFPYFSSKKGGREPDVFLREIVHCTGNQTRVLFCLPQVKHSFTRYQAHLYPVVFQVDDFFHTMNECEWIEIEQLKCFPFSSGHRKIFMHVLRASVLSTK